MYCDGLCVVYKKSSFCVMLHTYVLWNDFTNLYCLCVNLCMSRLQEMFFNWCSGLLMCANFKKRISFFVIKSVIIKLRWYWFILFTMNTDYGSNLCLRYTYSFGERGVIITKPAVSSKTAKSKMLCFFAWEYTGRYQHKYWTVAYT